MDQAQLTVTGQRHGAPVTQSTAARRAGSPPLSSPSTNGDEAPEPLVTEAFLNALGRRWTNALELSDKLHRKADYAALLEAMLQSDDKKTTTGRPLAAEDDDGLPRRILPPGHRSEDEYSGAAANRRRSSSAFASDSERDAYLRGSIFPADPAPKLGPRELCRILTELRDITKSVIDRLEKAGMTASSTAAAEQDRASQLELRNKHLYRENVALRAMLDESRAAVARDARRGIVSEAAREAAGDAGISIAVGVDRTNKLQSEIVALRMQLTQYESRAFEQASQLSIAVETAKENSASTVELTETKAALEAAGAKYLAAVRDWQADRTVLLHAANGMQQERNRAVALMGRAREAALARIATSAATRLAARSFGGWRTKGELRLLRLRLSDQQQRGDVATRLLATVEAELAGLKMKHHSAMLDLNVTLDEKRREAASLRTERDELHATVVNLRKVLSTGVGVNVAASSGPTASTCADSVATQLSPRNTNRQPADASQRAPQPQPTAQATPAPASVEQQQIEALSAYNVLIKTLRACKSRLGLKSVPVPTLDVHDHMTLSVTSIVIQWIKRVAGGFATLFSHDERLSQLRIQVIGISLATRSKIASIASRLATPVAGVERQLLQRKKRSYEELVARIGSLRQKIDMSRTSLHARFNVQQQLAARQVVEQIEADVALLQKVLTNVEKDQFVLSLRLTQVDLESRATVGSAPLTKPPPLIVTEPGVTAKRDASESVADPPPSGEHAPTPDPTIPPPPPPVNPVLAESRALVASLSSHQRQPQHQSKTPPPNSMIRSTAALSRPRSTLPTATTPLVPLEDRVDTENYAKMLLESKSLREPAPGLSPLTLAVARRERQIAQSTLPTGPKPTLPPIGMVLRGGSVIPFRDRPSPHAEKHIPTRKVRIASHILGDG